MKDIHIAVVGAGVIGGWTAYRLREKGAKVTLFDAWGPGNTRSSSGGETRILRAVYGPDRIYVEMVARSLEGWRTFEKKWDRTCFVRTGTLWMFSDNGEAYLKTSLPYLETFGFSVQSIEIADLPKRYPKLATEGLHSAWFEPESGFLYAKKACEQVCEAFVRSGGEYRTAGAYPGAIGHGKLDGLRLSDGSAFTADVYVFACGPWLVDLFPELLKRSLSVSRQEIYFFSTPPGSAAYYYPTLPVWMELGNEIYYGIPSPNDRGFKVADDLRSHSFDPNYDDRIPTPERLLMTRNYLEKRFPELALAPLQESRVCQYTNSPDGHFLIDRHPEAENLWIAGAGTGHAYKLGPAIGDHLSSLLLENCAPEDLFSLKRLEDTPEEKYTQFHR